MAFKIQDYKCEDCSHVTEILEDSKDENPSYECEKCKSKNLTKAISVGNGKGSNSTWSAWRAGMGN